MRAISGITCIHLDPVFVMNPNILMKTWISKVWETWISKVWEMFNIYMAPGPNTSGHVCSVLWCVEWLLKHSSWSWSSSNCQQTKCLVFSIFQVIIIFSFVDYTPATMGEYVYPPWAEGIGWTLTMTSILVVIGYAVIYVILAPSGSLLEVRGYHSSEEGGPKYTIGES